ncbi:GH1 family beta-glucosidase [Caproiciproducens galactitolivorans]|uniref:GH1 family beta-glucosidase n=1 Tax=Caproiciproducens galactitolivorans TaxID=642589 RepID=UPI00240A2272|nr:GH1 family beta-glucosidase [Caproiciproducens galactitolivorans]
MSFPNEFIWGTASAAYQIEGGVSEGGRGPSVWDTFSHMPGKIFENQNGDIACDAYHRYKEDIRLMAELGIHNYRFSISWARVIPDGFHVNPKGLEYYDRLVDCCLNYGITPWVTLYHWDLPQEVENQGGWTNRKTAKAFCWYAETVVRHFYERVRHWYTLNEPQCFIDLGYRTGTHAPGRRENKGQVFHAMHNALLAHGLAAKAMRSIDPGLMIGVATTGRLCYPASLKPSDREAAKAATFFLADENWCFTHHWFLDPLFFGHYPECGGTFLEPLAKSVPEADWADIQEKPDFIGMNIYHGMEAEATPEGAPSIKQKYTGYPCTATKWPVTPQVMYWGTKWIHERYGAPIIISENGQSGNDRIYLDGKVHDPDRIDFLKRYLRELERAIRDGVNIRGYFHWSFTDNFEWALGYGERFGLIYIDYPTQKRIPKDSAAWYAAMIKCNNLLF